MTVVQIELPDATAQAAREAGLLTTAALEKLLNEAIRHRPAAQAKGSFRDLYGCLKGKTNGARLSIEQINEAIAEAGAAAGAGRG